MPLYLGDNSGIGSVNTGTSDWKDSVVCATTANITLSGLQTIDGVSVQDGYRVLVKNQTTASQNGIYLASASTWSRSSDASSDNQMTYGTTCWVANGTTQSSTLWRLTTVDPIVVGTTSLTFTQFTASSGATPVGAKGDVQFKGTGATLDYESAAGYGFNYDTTLHSLTVGPAGTNLTNNPFSANGNVNSYVQSNVQNNSNGVSASSDIVATANNGNDNTNFIDMGINSSGYADGTFTIAGANDSYLYSSGGHIAIGTDTANKDIVLFTAGTLAANEAARITSSNNVLIGRQALATNATNGFLYVAGSAGTPTGTPTSYSGRVPLTFDTTNSILYYYSGSAWKAIDPALNQYDWKESVRLATAAALPANTRTNNVLTASANAALTIDGVAVAANDRVLVKNEATGANNGIYFVSDTGAANRPWILTRAPDANTSTYVTNGQSVYVGAGNTNSGQVWILTTSGPITLNTTSQTWTQYQPNAKYNEVNAAGTITTTSTTDVVATSMTITPGAGTYQVMFTTDINNNTNATTTTVSCYQNGSIVTNSSRQFITSATTLRVPMSVSCIATVAAGQAIDIRWKVSSGTGSMGARSLSLIKVG